MSDELIFVRKLPFSAILIQGQLIQVRHQPVKTKSDLFACSLSDKRIWLPIRDPNSSKKIIIVLSAYSPNVCYMAEPLTTHSDYVAQTTMDRTLRSRCFRNGGHWRSHRTPLGPMFQESMFAYPRFPCCILMECIPVGDDFLSILLSLSFPNKLLLHHLLLLDVYAWLSPNQYHQKIWWVMMKYPLKQMDLWNQKQLVA